MNKKINNHEPKTDEKKEKTSEVSNDKKRLKPVPLFLASAVFLLLIVLTVLLTSTKNLWNQSAEVYQEQETTSYDDTSQGSVSENKQEPSVQHSQKTVSDTQSSGKEQEKSLQSSDIPQSSDDSSPSSEQSIQQSSLTAISSPHRDDSQTDTSSEVKKFLIHYTAEKYAEINRYGYSAADVRAGRCSARKLIVSDEFNYAEFSSENYGDYNRLTCRKSIGCNTSDRIILQFAAYTSSGASKLDVNIGGIENRVSLSKDPYYFYITASGINQIDSVSFTSHTDQDVYISDAVLLNYGNAYDILALTTGCYRIGKYDKVNIDAADAIASKAKSAVINGNYMYAVSGTPEGCLSVYKLHNSGRAEYITQINGLGDARDISFNHDKSAVIITARRRGAHIVDIRSPEHPVISAEYDTIEYACGLCTEGNYAFICCRWFGVEVVDISNIYHPKYVCTLSGDAEYQGCYVNNGILYVSAYNEKRVDVWDVHNLNNPVRTDYVYLDGAGQGLCADGKYLYAATALNSSNDASSVADYGKGTGNGLEIFDIQDKNNIRWVSTVKFDGRFNINYQDVWDVEVSGNLAYVSCMCYGTVIVDISDKSCPKIKKQLQIHADAGSEQYVNYNADRNIYVWSFDNEEESYGAVFHTIPAEGRLYIISSNMGIYTYQSADIHPAVHQSNSGISYTNRQITLPKNNILSFEHYACGTQIWAVDSLGSCYALACGSGGIRILNKDLQQIAEWNPGNPVRDIRVDGDLIYTAESSGGLGIYQWKNGKIISISHCVTDRSDICFGSLELTSDGNYAIVECSMVSHCVINISDIYHPYEMVDYRQPKLGSTYYRTICIGLVGGKYVGIGGEKNITWFSSQDGNLTQIEPQKNYAYSRSGGMAAYGSRYIAIYDGGYVLSDPETNRTSAVIYVSGTQLEGKAAIWGNTLIVSREFSDLVTFVDISDIEHPKLITEIHIDGNPDIGSTDGNALLLPCRNGGLLRITQKR